MILYRYSSFPRALLARIPAFIIMAALFFLSSKSSLPHPNNVMYFDKIAHFSAYAALAASFSLWFTRASFREAIRCLFISAALASAFALSDEIHQVFTPGRTPDLFDWLADASGALLGSTIAALLLHRFLSQHKLLGKIH